MGKVKGDRAGQPAENRGKRGIRYGDLLAIFGVTFILAVLLEKAEWYIDWDTLDSVLKMNAPGYSPFSQAPSHYHALVEPLVYLTTAVLSPLLGQDHMIGYMLLVAVFSGGLLALAYLTVYKLTENRVSAWVSVILIAVSYNFVFLTFCVGQNVLNQFFNLLSIFLAFCLLGVIRTKLDSRLVAALLGLSIALAIGTNLRSVYLVVLLPLAVLLCKDRLAALKTSAVALASLAIGAAYLVLSSLLLSRSGLSLDALLNFFSVGYYSDPNLWYFANPAATPEIELLKAARGFISSLFGVYVWAVLGTVSLWLPVLVAAIVLLIFGILLYKKWKEPAVVVLVVLFLLNSAHSFLYEPVSLERWDHGVLLLGLLGGVAWSTKPFQRRQLALAALAALMAVGTLLVLFNLNQVVLFAIFEYEKIPAASFSEHPGIVVTGQLPTTEQALYLKYLYGPDNVRFYDSSVPAGQVLSDVERVNRPVYYDSVIISRFDYVNDEEGFVDKSQLLGSLRMPWYVYYR